MCIRDSNDSNCVPENEQFTLQYIVYNLRDPFTNLTVRWFRSMDVTRAISSTEVITTNILGGYADSSNVVTNSTFDTNCTRGLLYKDTFFLVIHNFTTDKDGYYWCQIVVNDSYLQLSQYAWFYAADSSSCKREYHFMTAPKSEIQCAENYTDTYTVITETTNTIIIAPSTTNSTYVATNFPTSSSPTQTTVVLRMTESVIYVAGFFSALLVLLGALVIILLLLLCVCKNKSHRKKIQMKSEP